jgi:hypothetical protein
MYPLFNYFFSPSIESGYIYIFNEIEKSFFLITKIGVVDKKYGALKNQSKYDLKLFAATKQAFYVNQLFLKVSYLKGHLIL